MLMVTDENLNAREKVGSSSIIDCILFEAYFRLEILASRTKRHLDHIHNCEQVAIEVMREREAAR